MAKAFGIVAASPRRARVTGLQDHRPIGAFSFAGRYRTIDFPVSNLSNSDIDRIQVYVRQNPRSLTEHLGDGRQYNINSKHGKLQVMFAEQSRVNAIYDTDIAAYSENLDIIARQASEYVVIVPSCMVFKQDFRTLLNSHIESGADITLLYHRVDNARESFLNCNILNLNRQKGVESIEGNPGSAKVQNVFMDTYIMKRDLFTEIIRKAQKESSTYTLSQCVSLSCQNLDVRGVAHKGYFASLLDLNSYFDANMDLLDYDQANALFNSNWPIYTTTTDSSPTRYYDGASVKQSLISNGCCVEGSVENSVIGRGVKIKKGAVVKNCVILAYTTIGEDVHVENQIIDKWAKITKTKEIIATPDAPGYIERDDVL